MKKIINRSGHVLTISNRCFSRDIPIDSELVISDEEVGGDYCLTIEFFSHKHLKKENTVELKRGLDNIAGIWVDMHSSIPMKTVVDLKDYTEALVTEKDIEFHFLTLLIKRISLRRAHVEDCPSKEKTEFVSDMDRRYFKRWLFWELLITFFLFPFLIYASFFATWGRFEQISLSLITVAFVFCYARKLVYLVRYFKSSDRS